MQFVSWQGRNLRKIIFLSAFSATISMLFQETLEAVSQQLSWYTFNADMYSF